MTIHSCSYYCDKPECIKSQRDELRESLAGLMEQNTELDQRLAGLELTFEQMRDVLENEPRATVACDRLESMLNWPFPPPGFKHPRPGDRVLGLDDYEDALL